MIIERTNTGYCAYATKYLVYTEGSNFPEIKRNMIEASNLYFDDLNKTVTASDLKITLDLPDFFEFYKVINAKALSARIGINQTF